MRFSTTMFQTGNNTGIEVPADVVDALGAGKRPPVTRHGERLHLPLDGRVDGRKYLLPFSAERRSESGISGGDAIDVELELDTAPRVVDVPEDLRAALDGSPDAAAAWAKLSYSQQKAHVTSVSGAKAAETRDRRVAAVVTKLVG